MAQWPGHPAFMVGYATPGAATPVITSGAIDEIRPWASVSKVAVGLAAQHSFAAGAAAPTDPAGPEGATIAHLLAHASGLGFEAGDRTVPVGSRRVYSNSGYDLVGEALGGSDPSSWVNAAVLEPLGGTARMAGRIGAGVTGSVQDLALLASELLAPQRLTETGRNQMVQPFLPDLDGITPPFGRQTPNWWGLGPELKGLKRHWMGTWPPSSFGHFGQSGALLLCDPTTNLFVCATSTEPFGDWARVLWPEWIDQVRVMATS